MTRSGPKTRLQQARLKDEVAKLTAIGWKPSAIAQKIGCKPETIYQWLRTDSVKKRISVIEKNPVLTIDLDLVSLMQDLKGVSDEARQAGKYGDAIKGYSALIGVVQSQDKPIDATPTLAEEEEDLAELEAGIVDVEEDHLEAEDALLPATTDASASSGSD